MTLQLPTVHPIAGGYHHQLEWNEIVRSLQATDEATFLRVLALWCEGRHAVATLEPVPNWKSSTDWFWSCSIRTPWTFRAETMPLLHEAITQACQQTDEQLIAQGIALRMRELEGSERP